ncbi:helix-turn-helix domain-containing protein [[Ruminococcus] torques]|uniref:helix-turn-helix domain-containing protein n=1 Tax=[Ruminococcus] torques TaxID=33039 RepID=UPI003AB32874
MVKVNLWEVRNAKGLKLEAVAAMTGVSKSTLNNIENGKTSPTLANLEKIAKGLDCRINDLYESEYK